VSEHQKKIDTMLGEFRMIVPALGALLGFQLVVAFQQSFQDLPGLDRTANFAGVACTMLALLFLLVPASYHRFTPRLDESRDFLTFAQRMVGTAFVFLPLALALSLYVQAERTFRSPLVSLACATVLLVLLAGGWWGLPALRARRLERA
jgi:hypothetical protein